MNKTLAIGIATYNRHAILKRCLENILRQKTKPEEVIIVDSTEKEFIGGVLKELGGVCKITYKKLNQRTSLPAGRNIILSLCNTEYISFIDDDSLPRNDYVEEVKKTFSRVEIAGVTGPTINCDISLKPREKIIRDNLPRTWVAPWGDVYSDTRRWIPQKTLSCATMAGGNMTFRTAVIVSVGGFDENFTNPSFREETDAQMHIRNLGYTFLYNPNVYVDHIVGVSGGIEDIEKKRNEYFFLAGKNHKYFCDKHFSKWLTRLSWIFLNRTPPCLWLALILTVFRKENYLMWHKGLWSTSK